MHRVINVTACWQWYVLSFLYRRGEGLLVLYIQKLHSDVIFPILRSLKIPFLNYCKAITLHICIFPYVIVISSKKNIFPTSDIIFNTHIILAANDLSVSDDSFSRFFFRILLSSRDRKRRVEMSVAESPCFACPNAVTVRVQNPSHLSGLLIIPFNLFPAAEDRPCCLRCTEYRRGALPFTIILA